MNKEEIIKEKIIGILCNEHDLRLRRWVAELLADQIFGIFKKALKAQNQELLKKIERRLNKLKGKKADIEIIEFLEDLIKILK